MALTATRYEHIALNAEGMPVIAGKNFKVIMLVGAMRADGLGPEELHDNFPALTLGEIHSALAYYWDHQEEMDAELARRDAFAREMERTTPVSPFVARLRAERGH
jgi:uncharacterized protein (DUF433 family)